MREYSYSLILAIGTFFYGLHMQLVGTYVRILEPPMRYVLIAGLILVPILSLIFIFSRRNRLLKHTMSLNAGLWAMVGTMYLINPIPNGGWVLAYVIMLINWNLLVEGDWRCEN